MLAAASYPVRGGAAPAVNYRLAHTFALPGDGGWDYLSYDPAGKRLFVSRATRVMVIDPVAGTVLSEIPDTPRRARHRAGPGRGQGLYEQRA